MSEPNAYDAGRAIEKLGEADLLPYMERVWPKCIYYPTHHHVLVQKIYGDVLVKWKKAGRYVEFKIEQANDHDNFYIEMWSNKARRTWGWFHYCWADWMWYYFLKERQLYIFTMTALREWARINHRLLDFPEKPQGKRVQRNDTWGHCVPIAVLQKELPGFRGPIDPTKRQ